MSLAGLHVSDAIRHVQGCQFPDNARLDSTHKPILCPQDQIQILLGQLGSESLLQVAVHALEVEVELVVELRRDVTVVGLQKLVVEITQQTRNTLGELEVVVAQTSKISKARQFSAPDGELPALARSRGEKVPFGVSRWSQGRFSRRLRSTRSRGRSTCNWWLLLGNLGGRLHRWQCS